jgi:hypothetical protein
VIYNCDKCRWETCNPEEVKELLEKRKLIKAVQLMASFFAEEVKCRPLTHAQHDRLIKRLKKLSKILERVWIWDRTYEPNRAIMLFRSQSEKLVKFTEILEAFSKEVKRERLWILEFIYPWLQNTIDEIMSLSVVWMLKGTYYSKAFVKYDFYCRSGLHEVREWISLHVSDKKRYYTKSLTLEELQQILNKAIERREWRKWHEPNEEDLWCMNRVLEVV